MTTKFDEEYMQAVSKEVRKRALATIENFFEEPDVSMISEVFTCIEYLRDELIGWIDHNEVF
jgi:hypothetical protein